MGKSGLEKRHGARTLIIIGAAATAAAAHRREALAGGAQFWVRTRAAPRAALQTGEEWFGIGASGERACLASPFRWETVRAVVSHGTYALRLGVLCVGPRGEGEHTEQVTARMCAARDDLRNAATHMRARSGALASASRPAASALQ
ncbi:hypothetical protein JKP88DRAFT_273451 [Tribonema minus]|uniref:Uncharacterized protein n=1 Tax=Tribonema minus TaxID=303371 RepID=A0A835YVC8_9STRA|nr:hypothetical protein JKP88DRAFT_273451 [Tribonema minus]